ncbi:hypothetical protein QLH51_05715 [Sphingomonas sp. 2R-10]|uniref:hypothetical protein n=1 Tax=Sphingomonas sp. 2R-10 TaxID=3045148 RepID=UPI000F7905DE|nr:hypothetical protein [Sphingomonas sp. 2R-10]MDJ0276294.1 hypothetical protein [Sphingomonas sp. 2R-10]
MATNDLYHGDLFDVAKHATDPVAAVVPDADQLPLLAIPCGFRNSRNAPCRRLGNRPVMIDGEPFHHRGCRIVHCDTACFRDADCGADDARTIGTP